MPTLTSQDLQQRVVALLTAIAPDIDPATIDPEQELRDQFDFDSMDRLHFATSLCKDFKIDIPEHDYPELAGLRKACDYVAKKLKAV